MKKVMHKFIATIAAALILFAVQIVVADEPLPDASSGSLPAAAIAEGTNVPGGTTPGSGEYQGPRAEYRIHADREARYVPPMPIKPTSPLKPRLVTAKDFYLNVVDVSVHKWLIVKFTEEAKVRMSNGTPYSKAGADLSDLFAFLSRHPEIKMYRETESVSEEMLDYLEANGERNTGKDLANLNNFYVLQSRNNVDPMALILEVIELNNLETAFYAPNVEEACADVAPVTPEWTNSQNHLEAAPLGVNALYAWGYHTGGNGNNGSWCIDVEQNWTENHEDFPAAFSVLYGGDGGTVAEHGDACVGLVAACNNSYGMTGISYDVEPYAISWPQQPGADNDDQFENSFVNADAILISGESYFIEIHAQGPSPGGVCDAGCGNCSQWRYIAVEYWDNVFTAIETGTANGIIVYEAGGNGQMNLDNAIYGGRFNRAIRDSDAIIVGATDPNTHEAKCWSSYGSRLDCNGWGSGVWTLGYGDLQDLAGEVQDYTSSFSGTSSATPIVTGSGNDLQGIAQEKYGVTLNSAQIRSILSFTGTPWEGTRDVGERPDLVEAINWLEPEVYPATPGGWSYSFTPRETGGATNANCLITSNLDGNANTTYLNFAGWNASDYVDAPGDGLGSVYTQLYIDNVWVWWVSTGSMGSNSWSYWNNWGPIEVRGGRHMTRWWMDPNDEFNERSESNNWIYRQFAWSPYGLTNGTGITRNVPPLKDWGSPTYLSGDGFRATGTWWTAVGVMGQTGNDVDLNQHANTYTSTTGYQANEDASSYGGTSTDFIVTNGNTLGFGQTRMYQAIRFTDSDTDDYAIEGDGSTTIGSPYTVTNTMGAYEVLDVFEFNPGAGTTFFCGVDQITGDIDLAIALFQPNGDYHDRAEAWIEENDGGAEVAEAIYTNSPGAGWYGCVVFKPLGSTGYGNGGTYRFRYSTNLQPDITTIPRPGWDDEVVLRNTNDATFSLCEFPAQLHGNTTNYLNRTYFNEGTGIAGTPFRIETSIDGVVESNGSNGGLLYPLEYAGLINTNIGNVNGGRHTVTMILDADNDETESDELDNDLYSRQLVWSPLALTRDAGITRTAPAERGTGFYPNADGFTYDTPNNNVGTAVAILATVSTSDFDIEYHGDYLGTFSGFSSSFALSSFGTNALDYAYIGYLVSQDYDPYFPAVFEFNNGTSTYIIEAEAGIAGRVFGSGDWVLSDPDTLSSSNLINIYEIFMQGGIPFRLHCDVIGGTAADIGIRIFPENAVTARTAALATMNAGGGGVDEILTYTPVSDAYYGVVVEKVNSASATLSSIYNLSGGEVDPQDIDSLVIQPWINGRRRLAWNHAENYGGSPIPGRRYVIYRSTNFATIPLPTDSIGGTTDSVYVDGSVLPGLLYYYNVIVKGN